jgi:hypothetical protein
MRCLPLLLLLLLLLCGPASAAAPAAAPEPAQPDAALTAPLGQATHPEGCGTSDYPFPQPSAALLTGLGAERALARLLAGELPPLPAAPAAAGTCSPRQVVQGRNAGNTGLLAGYDMRCTGHVDLEIDVPDDASRPIVLRADRNLDGKPDLIVLDAGRQGHWSVSYWDVAFDGRWALIGRHPDGRMEPSSFEMNRGAGARSEAPRPGAAH